MPIAINLARASQLFSDARKLVPQIFRASGLSPQARFHLSRRFSHHRANDELAGSLDISRNQFKFVKHVIDDTLRPQKLLYPFFNGLLHSCGAAEFLGGRNLRHFHPLFPPKLNFNAIIRNIILLNNEFLGTQAVRVLANAVVTPGRFGDTRPCSLCSCSVSSAFHWISCRALFNFVCGTFPRALGSTTYHPNWLLQVIFDMALPNLQQARHSVLTVSFVSIFLVEACRDPIHPQVSIDFLN